LSKQSNTHKNNLKVKNLNKTFVFVILAFFPIIDSSGYIINSRNNADKHPIKHTGTLTNPYESLIIGNGDLAVSASIYSHELILQIGKNDVWDSRIDVKTDDVVLKHDSLVASNGDIDTDRPVYYSMHYINSSQQAPSPKPVGMIKIRHPGLSNTKISSLIDIEKGILTVRYEFPDGRLIIETFVHRDKNKILVKMSSDGEIPWISLLMEKPPDYADNQMPMPVITKENRNKWAVSQTIPGNYGVNDFTWYFAGSFPENPPTEAWVSNVIEWNYALQKNYKLKDRESIVFSSAVTTTREPYEQPLTKAFQLAGETDMANYTSERSTHIQAWEKFWQASSIELDDKELEAQWYRCIFGFASHLKPGAQAPGLNANIPIFDYSAWNGAYTWNHNVQKWYFPALAINHREWYEVLAELIEQSLPTYEYLAKLIFDLDGVYIGLMTYPYAPPERALTHPVFGRALAHTGWLSSLLFKHFEYTYDTLWLQYKAYSYISRAADFYANYLDKYQQEDGTIMPSMLLEDTPEWSPGFIKSKNVLTDLIMFKKTFRIAVRSAEILKTDSLKIQRWTSCLDRIPDIKYGEMDGKSWYAIYDDWEKAWPDFNSYLEHLRSSRWGCSGWPIFPGEFVNGDEAEGLAKAVRGVIRETDILNLPDNTRMLGTFHGEANFLPFIRGGIMEKYHDLRTLILNHRFESGQFSPFSNGENRYVSQASISSWRIVENQYFPILGITEMLLQCQGNIIRLFPFWPDNHSASFNNLMTEGAFLVSAEYIPDNSMTANITSLKGNECRIRWKGKQRPLITHNEQPVEFELKNHLLTFDTEANNVYVIRSMKIE
jgi:alpha-L-fucosidase 2